MAKTIKITDEGLKKLTDELEYLKTEGRTDIAEKIKIARGYGDLSENSEYDEAKNEQAKIEARIVELEAMLKNVEIISDVKDVTTGKEFEYRIVGSTEADPRNGKISDECPVGRAILGHRAGDEVVVEAPSGEIRLELLNISR